MHSTLRNEKVLLAAIAAASATMLKPNAYDADKVNQLKDLGFVNSDFITNSDDHLANHQLAVQYQEKYPEYKFLTEIQMNSIFSDFDLSLHPLNNVFRDVPEKNINDILKFEIERGLIAEPIKDHYSDHYDAIKLLLTSYKIPDGLMRQQPLTGLSIGTKNMNSFSYMGIPATGFPGQTAPKAELEVKKTNHMNTLKMNFQEIRKDFPQAIYVITDNHYVEDDEKLNYYLLTLKVKGGLLIITDWQV